jgi:hypothetical protein
LQEEGTQVPSGQRRTAATMDQLEVTTRIDEALDRYRSREMVSASEVVDLLLDLRLMLLAADEEARSTSAS